MPSEYAATRHTVRHSPLTPVIQSHHLPLPSLLRWDAFSSSTSEWEERRRLTAYGVAAMVMPDEVGRYAYRKGLFVMAQSGDTVLIRNDDKFQPREW